MSPFRAGVVNVNVTSAPATLTALGAAVTTTPDAESVTFTANAPGAGSDTASRFSP